MGNEASPSMTIAIDDETAIDDNDTVATNNGISDEGTAVDGINDDIDNATPAVAAAALTSDLDVEAEIKPEEGIHESDADDQPQYGKNSATTIIDTDVPLDVVAVSPSSSSSDQGGMTEDTSNVQEEIAESVMVSNNSETNNPLAEDAVVNEMSSQAQLEINDNDSIRLPTLPSLELPSDDIDNDLDIAAATDDNQANTSASTLPPIEKASGDDAIVAELPSDQIYGEINTTSIGNDTSTNTSNSQGTMDLNSTTSLTNNNSNSKKEEKQLQKMQRRIPSSLDMHYITPRIIGMAPPLLLRRQRDLISEEGGGVDNAHCTSKNVNDDDDDDGNNNNSSSSNEKAGQQLRDDMDQSANQQPFTRRSSTSSSSRRTRKRRGNDVHELVSYLEKRHAHRYLLFNVSDDDDDNDVVHDADNNNTSNHDGTYSSDSEHLLSLLGWQVVHLPWGSPRRKKQFNYRGGGGGCSGGCVSTPSPSSIMRKGIDAEAGDSISTPISPSSSYGGVDGGEFSVGNSSVDGGNGINNRSSTPSVARVMDICYALHAYLSIPPHETPLKLSTDCATTTNDDSSSSSRRGGSNNDGGGGRKKKSTVACVYCGNGKTRTGVTIACYLRFCNMVPSALRGFELFCTRRGIMSSSSSSTTTTTASTPSSTNKGALGEAGAPPLSDTNTISNHIPPSLRQFFRNFDELVHRKQYPHPEPLLLSSIQLKGVPVDDMPCLDVWEHGDIARRRIYSSHVVDDDSSNTNNTLPSSSSTWNEWEEEEGTYHIRQQKQLVLHQDFTLVCRFGGEFAADVDDPSKVLFRYVNCPHFLREGKLTLNMLDVDMMRRYAGSFDSEEFSITLVFENVGTSYSELDTSLRRTGIANISSSRSIVDEGGTKFNGFICDDKYIILQGWKVLSDAHLLHPASECEAMLVDDVDSSVCKVPSPGCFDIDFRWIALQLSNGNAEGAKAELDEGLFQSLLREHADSQEVSLELHQPVDSEESPSLEKHLIPFDQICSILNAVCQPSNSVLGSNEHSTDHAALEGSEVQNDGQSNPLVSEDVSTEVTSSDIVVQPKQTFVAMAAPNAKDEHHEEIDESSRLNSHSFEQHPAALAPTIPDIGHLDQSKSSNDTHEAATHDSLATDRPSDQMPEVNAIAAMIVGQSQLSLIEVTNGVELDDGNEIDEVELESRINGVITSSLTGESLSEPPVLYCDTALDISEDVSIASDAGVLMGIDQSESNENDYESEDFRAELSDHDCMAPSAGDLGSSNSDGTKLQHSSSLGGSTKDSGIDKLYPSTESHGSKVSSILSLAAAAAIERRVRSANSATTETVPPSASTDDAVSEKCNRDILSTAATAALERKILVGQILLPTDGPISATEVQPVVDECLSSNEKNRRDMLTMAATAALERRARAGHLPSAVEGSSDGAETVTLIPLQSSSVDEKNRRGILTLAATAALERKANGDSRSMAINVSAISGVDRLECEGLQGAVLPASEHNTLPLNALSSEANCREMFSKRATTNSTNESTTDNDSNVETKELKREASTTELCCCDLTVTLTSLLSKESSPNSADKPMRAVVLAKEIHDDYPLELGSVPLTIKETVSSMVEPAPEVDLLPIQRERAPPQDRDLPREDEKKESEPDPRSALHVMLSKRISSSQCEDPTILEKQNNDKHAFRRTTSLGSPAEREEREHDQRSALLGTSTIRTAPPPAKEVTAVAVEKVEGEIGRKPKATIMAMLSKRAPPSAEEMTIDDAERDENEVEPNPNAAIAVMLSNRALPSAKEMNMGSFEHGFEEAEQDPKAAIAAMLSIRAQPLANVVTSDERGEDDIEPDPKAAIVAMLSKRAQPPVKELFNAERDEKEAEQDPKAEIAAMLSKRTHSLAKEFISSVEQGDEASEQDPKAALTAMLSRRAPPPAKELTSDSAKRKEEDIDPKAAIAAMLSRRTPPPANVVTSDEREEDDIEPDPKAAIAAMLSKRAQPPANVVTSDEREEDDIEPDPKAALMALLSKRAQHPANVVTSDEREEDDTEPDPKAALMAMLSKRAQPPANVVTSDERKEDDIEPDPKAALIAMLSKRAQTPAKESTSDEREEDDIEPDPKAALMAMLSKRARPSANVVTSDERKEDDIEPDPKAALMAMLSKRAQPPANVVTSDEREEDDIEPDPKAALMAMLSKRAPPPVKELSTDDAKRDGKDAEPDPKAANAAMLSRRAPTPAKEVTSNSAKRKEEDIEPDPKAAIMAMLSKRAPPPVKELSTDDAKRDGKDTEPDPKAAIAAMLSKRAQPPAKELTSNSAKRKEEDIELDPKSALMAMLSKRAQSSANVVTSAKRKEEDIEPDPKAALMAMLSKRAQPPANVVTSDEREEEDIEPDPKAALVAMMNKRTPPTSVRDRTSDTKVLSGTKSDELNEQMCSQTNSPAIRDDPRFVKYFKMLKMGLPIGAVKNSMQRDQQDPTIMDLDPEKSLESQRPPKLLVEDDPALNKDPIYEKYFRMLKMGLSIGAVKNALQRDGLDPKIMDLDPLKSVSSQMVGNSDELPLKEDPTYSKYFKMLKMGLPMGAVKNALQRDGLDPSIMDLDPGRSVVSQLQAIEEKEVDKDPPLKDDPTYSKYFKMLKMGLPMGAVRNALQRDGLDPSIMDLDPDISVNRQLEKEKDNHPPLKDDPEYSKYFKMLSMGLPMGAVKNAFQRDGLDPSIMDLDPEKSVASQLGKGKEINVTDESQTNEERKKKSTEVTTTTTKPQKPNVRRKKIFWSPIEESKIDDNSLWSMIKGKFDFDSLKFDQDEFESLFTDTSNSADKKKVVSDKPREVKQKKSVQVIDAKRGMNGGIILARIKVGYEVLAKMVIDMDCGELDDTQLKALKEFLPTKEERFAIEGYITESSSSEETKEAAINDLCACEKYMLAMMNVEMADEKFECMLFKYQFDNKSMELMKGITTLIDACDEVQKSVRLRKLMAMILMLGNQINTGGSGRVAHGFTLDALLKLDEAKAFDKKTSVLQYLVKLVKTNEPDLLNVHKELPSIGPAENVIVDGLASELKELNERLNSVKETATLEGNRLREGVARERSSSSCDKPRHQKVSSLDKLRQQKTKIKDIDGVHMYNIALPSDQTAMEKFVLHAEKRTEEMFTQIDKAQENFNGVLTYFGEDPAMTSTDFFGTLNKFVAAFDSALEVVKRIEALEIAEQKKESARRAKAMLKPNHVVAIDKQKPDLVSQTSKGKLDLSGQRRKFADHPGAHQTTDQPMNESEENKVTEQMRDPKVALMEMPNKRQPKVEATAVEQTDVGSVLERRVTTQSPPSKGQQAPSSEPSMPLAPVLMSNITSSQPPCSPSSNENHQLSPESPTINGFFPATTRHIRQQSKLDNENQSDRDARYENKTSSDARGIREAESTSQPASPLARVPDINVLEIPSSPNSRDLSPESKCVNPSTALHSMKDDNDGKSDSIGASHELKYKAAESGIAPLATMRRQNDKLRNRGRGSMSIAAMAAAAAREKNAKAAMLLSPLTTVTKDDGAATIDDLSSIPTEKSPTKHADLPTLTYACVACGERLVKSHFSKNQLSKSKKNEVMRCKKCTQAQRPAELEPKQLNEESFVLIHAGTSCETVQEVDEISESAAPGDLNSRTASDEENRAFERLALIDNDGCFDMRSVPVVAIVPTDAAMIDVAIEVPPPSAVRYCADEPNKGVHGRLPKENQMTNHAALPSSTCFCSACGQRLEKSQFSKNQLAKAKKNEIVRCKQCIAVQKPAQLELHP